MLSRRRTRTAIFLVATSACTPPPPGETMATVDLASSSASASASSTTAAATSDATSTTTGEPGSSGTGLTTTGSTTTSSGTEASSSTTTSGGPPSTCGPPCAETWEVNGALDIANWGDPPITYQCLTAVHGDLTIEPDVPEGILAGLANLRQVDGNLQLQSHATLGAVDFLACLERTGALHLANAPMLSDLSALAQLRAADAIYFGGLAITALPTFAPDFSGISYLSLESNPALIDLSAASSWGVFSDALQLTFTDNAALTDLAGLAGLITDLGGGELYVQITDHPVLTSLVGFEPATDVVDLYLARLPQLASLGALAGLTHAGGITLDELPKLTTLAGLHNITSANSLTIGGCLGEDQGGLDAIPDLGGLDALIDVGTLAIANNDLLVSLDGAPTLSSILGVLSVTGNPTLTQKAFDAFLAQLALYPNDACFGPWDMCACFQVLPW